MQSSSNLSRMGNDRFVAVKRTGGTGQERSNVWSLRPGLHVVDAGCQEPHGRKQPKRGQQTLDQPTP